MSLTEPYYFPGNLNPTAPAFLPANQHLIPIFIPIIHHPLPPPPPQLIYLPVLPNFSVTLPPTSLTPTRAVMLLNVPVNVSETSLRLDMEVFGEVRGVEMERVEEGIVTVHFYNLKHSKRALKETRNRHMHQEQVRFNGGYATARGLVSGRTVWSHFVFPNLRAVPEGNNQGTLVVLELEPTVDSSTLRNIFQAYGEVNEIRETPSKKEQRFVEFYDVRDAVKALHEMNGEAINGKPIVVQISRPGGLCKKLFLPSRFNNNHHHYHPPPPPPSDHHRQLPSTASVTFSNANKKHFKRNFNDDRFTINEEAIATAEESTGRTTVMIRNIPNKYTQQMLLDMLDIHCNDCNKKIIEEGNRTVMSSYDFVYLPIDISNKCNVGYGFVNMTSPEAVWRLYKVFHNQQWGLFNSRKICEITYARLQGVESLKEHFKNWRLPGGETEEFMPVLFSPPRDGRLLSEAISIVDSGNNSCQSEESTVSDKTLEGSDGCCLGERR